MSIVTLITTVSGWFISGAIGLCVIILICKVMHAAVTPGRAVIGVISALILTYFITHAQQLVNIIQGLA